METITQRLKNLIAHKTTTAKRFKELEELTKIPSGTWRTWWNKDSRPSGEMIEVVAGVWPEFAFWLATGITDSKHGHHSPNTDEIQDTWIPIEDKKLEQRYRTKKRLRTAARDYFLARIAIQRLPSWNQVADNENEKINLQSQFAALLREMEVLGEIRNQQELTLATLEKEAALQMIEENGFDDSVRRFANERIKNEENLGKDDSSYSVPKPDDIAF